MADGGDVRRVLVADPDEGTRTLVRLTLSGGSYEVVETADTDETLRQIAAIRPELVLLDAGLPEVGGMKICRSVKAQPETGHARVILLFAKTQPVDRDEGDAAGVDDYLAKPFQSLGLLKKVDELLGGGQHHG